MATTERVSPESAPSETTSNWKSRTLWFVGLYLASLLTISGATYLFRFLLFL